MKRKWFVSSMLSLVTSVTLFACGQEQSDTGSSNNTKLSVVTTFYPVYEFTKEVAVDRADVSIIIEAGTDAHGFEPSARDVAAINDADIFAYSSGEMEPWVGGLMDSLDSEDLITVRTAKADSFISTETHEHDHQESNEPNEDSLEMDEDLPASVEIDGLAGHYHTGDVVQLVSDATAIKDSTKIQWYTRGASEDWKTVSGQTKETFEYETTGDNFDVKVVFSDEADIPYAQSAPIEIAIDDHEGLDPHIWLDPVLAQDQVMVIKEALIQADPDGKTYYEENAEKFILELQRLDEEYVAALSSATNRVFVVQHQAFGYIAQRYNLEQIAVGGISTEIESSPSRIAEISELVKQHNVPVIYYQQGADSSIAQTVGQETETAIEVLYDLESFSKGMQDDGMDYLTLMRKNLKALQLSIH
ncbi:zinc ABC transporter substrate-binding protein [Carnobacterium sp. ISL-102]|uniref:metal ABC transporter solute-binding protein, Zn/Mn family n=1 Tax=Carnobacterium sp. ISL-102 TaxID=2819142 RepID=UPI001BE7B4CB|nr:zinc ABC transporter substrate-binding protein [Carnobacterium sp. ISL-102]MBT2732741.1 zinc ABC transporter substrate-binding protein [Carnobacterium sp. ISL-102]